MKNHNLDYQIGVSPLHDNMGNALVGRNIPTHRVYNMESNQTFGAVTGKYQPVQNAEMIGVMDSLIESGYGNYDRIGVRNGGQTVWTSIALDTESFKIGGFDSVDQYVYLANHNDGNGALTFTPANVRFACTNQYAHAASQIRAAGIDMKALTIRHSSKMDERISAAIGAIGIVNTLNANFAESAEQLLEVSLDLKEREDIYAEVLGLTSKEKLQDKNNRLGITTRGMNKMNAMFELEKSPNNSKIADTAWGTYNTITEYFDHRSILNASGEVMDSRVDSAMFGTAARSKAKAFDLILEVAQVA